VAVARAADWRTLGADVELPTPLEEKLWELVLRPAEHDWIESQPEERRGVLAKLFFSAKESAYKCQAPLTGRLLEFTDVELVLMGDEQTGTFAVRWIDAEVARSVPELEGRWRLNASALVTAVALGH
jgi:4'-phosphopantetheinyl transferase EntD